MPLSGATCLIESPADNFPASSLWAHESEQIRVRAFHSGFIFSHSYAYYRVWSQSLKASRCRASRERTERLKDQSGKTNVQEISRTEFLY